MNTSRSPAITISEGELTAVIDGAFDMPATFAIEPALERALDAPGLRRFTLDLSGLTFIDSVGIGVVVRLAADLEEPRRPVPHRPGPSRTSTASSPPSGWISSCPSSPRAPSAASE